VVRGEWKAQRAQLRLELQAAWVDWKRARQLAKHQAPA